MDVPGQVREKDVGGLRVGRSLPPTLQEQEQPRGSWTFLSPNLNLYFILRLYILKSALKECLQESSCTC